MLDHNNIINIYSDIIIVYHENFFQGHLHKAGISAAVAAVLESHVHALCKKSHSIVGTCGSRVKEIWLQVILSERGKEIERLGQ